MAKPRKFRVEFRKNRSVRTRGGDLTRLTADDAELASDQVASERISGKGELTRKRTVIAGEPPVEGRDGLAI